MKRFVVSAALAFAFGAQAEEKDCHLKQIAALDLQRAPGGHPEYTIPLGVGGQEKRFVLELTAPFSVFSASLAKELGFKVEPLPRGIRPNVNGHEVKDQVTMSALSIGGAKADGFHMLVLDDEGHRGDGSVAGIVGLDLLENFDVELDLKAAKLVLFSRDHCAGKVVYWTDSYAKVPIEIDPSGHMSIGMRLDDRKVMVDLDAVEDSSAMEFSSAERILGVTPDSPGVTAAADIGRNAFRYPFKTLAVEGVTVNNPAIALFKSGNPECPAFRKSYGASRVCFGGTDVRLRGSVLSKLHLYFAFREKVLYVTPAEAHL